MSEGTRIRVLHMGLTGGRDGIESFLYIVLLSCAVGCSRCKSYLRRHGEAPAYGDTFATMDSSLNRFLSWNDFRACLRGRGYTMCFRYIGIRLETAFLQWPQRSYPAKFVFPG